MKKITRTIERNFMEVVIYDDARESLVTNIDSCYDMNEKEAFRYFSKKYASIGKVVNVRFKESETLKVSMDIETFVSLATVTPAVDDSPKMPAPIYDPVEPTKDCE